MTKVPTVHEDGSVTVPARAESEGVLGDGVTTSPAGSAEALAWREWIVEDQRSTPVTA